MYVQDNIAGGVVNGRIRVCGGIIEKPQGFVISFFGALGLGCSDGNKCDNHGDVDGNRIVKESTNDLLNKADGLWRKSGGVVDIFRVLDFGTIGGMRPGMGGILLAFGVEMLELVQCFVDVAWNRHVNSPVGVVPHESEAAEKRSGPVDGDGVQNAECGDEMVHGGVAGVLDVKIVNDKREHYGQVGVFPEQRRAGYRGIAVFGEIQSEAVVGNDTGLLEAGHAFLYLKVDPAV